MMKILVTGGAGFIGSHVATQLLQEGHEVVIIDNFNNYYDPKLKHDRIKKIVTDHPKVKVYKIDIANFEDVNKVFKKHNFDKICHLAAQAGVRYSLKNPFAYQESNNAGTLNIFEAAKRNGVKKIVYASSSSVYGNTKEYPFKETMQLDDPVSLYAATKKSNELLARSYYNMFGIESFGLRFFTVYGPRGRPDMALYIFTEKMIKGETIDLFNRGDMTRDFTFIDDITDGVISCIKKVKGYEIINLGRGEPQPLIKYVKEIERNLGFEAKKNLIPMQAGDFRKTHADISKARKLLGYNPKVSIEEGIKRFIDWYKEYQA